MSIVANDEQKGKRQEKDRCRSVFSVQQPTDSERGESRDENDHNVDGGQNEKAEPVERESFTESVKVFTEQARFRHVHRESDESRNDGRKDKRQQASLADRKGADENAHRYTEQGEEDRKQDGGDRRDLYLTRAVKRRKARPDAHYEEEQGGDALRDERLFSLVIAGFDHFGVAVEAVEQGYYQHRRDQIEVELERGTVPAEQDVDHLP